MFPRSTMQQNRATAQFTLADKHDGNDIINVTACCAETYWPLIVRRKFVIVISMLRPSLPMLFRIRLLLLTHKSSLCLSLCLYMCPSPERLSFRLLALMTTSRDGALSSEKMLTKWEISAPSSSFVSKRREAHSPSKLVSSRGVASLGGVVSEMKSVCMMPEDGHRLSAEDPDLPFLLALGLRLGLVPMVGGLKGVPSRVVLRKLVRLPRWLVSTRVARSALSWLLIAVRRAANKRSDFLDKSSLYEFEGNLGSNLSPRQQESIHKCVVINDVSSACSKKIAAPARRQAERRRTLHYPNSIYACILPA